MKWDEIREQYPHQWLLVEAIKAHSEADKRIVDEFTIVNTFPNSRKAMKSYIEFHEQSPERELYVLHTDREELNIS